MVIDMSLLDILTSYCANQYSMCGNCLHCTHPSGRCSGSCLKCADEVNYHREDGRTDYDCQNFMYYYVCRYSWKYCSEIMYALEQIDLSRYPVYNILSVGCGGAPDLMAFEKKISEQDTNKIFYIGYDINPYWNPIHDKIHQYAQSQSIQAKFVGNDIFDVLSDGKPAKQHYNIIVLEYLLSHFPVQNRVNRAGKLFDGLLQNVLQNRLTGSRFLFLINDIDHYQVRECFDLLLQKLNEKGYHALDIRRMHFASRSSDYHDGSIQYSTCNNRFSIPEDMKEKFNCAINCTSAQLIVEVCESIPDKRRT